VRKRLATTLAFLYGYKEGRRLSLPTMEYPAEQEIAPEFPKDNAGSRRRTRPGGHAIHLEFDLLIRVRGLALVLESAVPENAEAE